MNEEVKTVFRYNGFVINKNLEDITHAESLVTSAEGGSCINWILGHVILTRDYLFELFGLEESCDDNFNENYSRGTDKFNSQSAVDFSELLKKFNESQEKLLKALEEKDIRSDKKLLEEIPALSFHEAYHAGQTGIFRRLLGKDGKIK